ncbi:C39 family peptidase [Adlercreutzia sp. R21]|uniref:C39 family peptidase n=1 Tax=Adlercreutzia wanghongyangiae TaxID=3111451 RepID=A0ABU6IGM1_9ACTN|nr:C39 family peptidase [Adlercreutzia sp. R21]MEC4175498.1 C39 family peptidase [Adlercreutzia sp. R7]MEC4183352.1 C39 family peptidase [Adlercreutzia sp. R21]
MNLHPRSLPRYLLGIYLAILIAALASSPQPGWAQENNSQEEQDHLYALVEMFADYSPDIDVADITLSQPKPVYDLNQEDILTTDHRSWKVLSKGQIVALIFSVDSDEGSTYTLSTDVSSAIAKSDLSESEDLIFAEMDNVLYCLDNHYGNAKAVMQNDEGKTQLEVVAVEDLPMQKICQASNVTYEVNSPLPRSITVTSSKTLGVPHVMQGGDPICWAASVCQAGRYLTHNTTHTPRSLAMAIKGAYVAGTASDAQNGFARYTYPNSSTRIGTCSINGPLTDAQVRTWINSGIPVYARTLSNKAGGHAVIIDGYKTYSSGAMALRVVNPGIGGTGIIYATKTSGYYQFYYNSSEGNTFAWKTGTLVLNGWQKPYGGSTWSYLNTNGSTAKGWLSVTGTWYYFNSAGTMQTGWVKVSGKWYYLESNGAMATGWKNISGKWYSLDSSGAMRTGWYKEGSYWYYLRTGNNVPSGGPEGSMLANGNWSISGKIYRFDSSGHCLNP